MAQLRIEGLSKTFLRQDGAPLPVLRKLSIEAGDGEFVSLLGPSGSGKSTTLNVLAGLIEPDAGQVFVNGGTGAGSITYGYVFQQARLLNWKTVRENIVFALSACKVSHREGQGRIGHYLRLIGLQDFADEYPLQLSGGMRQRVALARALVIEPDVLLMDEPFSGLDELTARTMRVELLGIWHRERRTILFVTHNPLEAAYLADRIYLLSPRPATVIREVTVDLPRPRDIDDPALIPIQKSIVQTLLH